MHLPATNHRVLPVIVIAQFFCTSLWFAGNAVLPDLVVHLNIPANTLGHMVSAVQFGFITGTLVYAVLLIADRFPPSVVFFCSALLAALANLAIAFTNSGVNSLMLLRFVTGFFLAGIYPVGMKIAADHFKKDLGKALGFLVGALVLGTALPHLIKSFTILLPWRSVLYLTSGLAVLGGMLMWLLVPAVPGQNRMQSFNYTAVFSVFKAREFRSNAFGYFGHMWELYSFWAFVPFLLVTYNNMHPGVVANIPALSFSIIACGGLACVGSGYLSQRYGAKRTAFTALCLSGCCCLLSPLAFYLPFAAFIIFLIFWGLVVIADSPLFSSLVAQYADAQLKGTALTIVTCIGFSITIASIELLNYLSLNVHGRYIFIILAVGPALGLWNMLPLKKNEL